MSRPQNASRQTHLLLKTLLEQPRAWRYGYELSKATGLTSGTLYPLLIRLSDQGLLESKWQESRSPGRPPRHSYKLTLRGLRLAQEGERTLAETNLRLRKMGTAL
jgi:DNA-binding PadR family transcriptional regulator